MFNLSVGIVYLMLGLALRVTPKKSNPMAQPTSRFFLVTGALEMAVFPISFLFRDVGARDLFQTVAGGAVVAVFVLLTVLKVGSMANNTEH